MTSLLVADSVTYGTMHEQEEDFRQEERALSHEKIQVQNGQIISSVNPRDFCAQDSVIFRAFVGFLVRDLYSDSIVR
jgi:hypothetical protein